MTLQSSTLALLGLFVLKANTIIIQQGTACQQRPAREQTDASSLGCDLPHSGAAQELTPGLCLPHQILCFDPWGFDSTTNDAGTCDVNPPVADKGGW